MSNPEFAVKVVARRGAHALAENPWRTRQKFLDGTGRTCHTRDMKNSLLAALGALAVLAAIPFALRFAPLPRPDAVPVVEWQFNDEVLARRLDATGRVSVVIMERSTNASH